jgi:hypothetical protein
MTTATATGTLLRELLKQRRLTYETFRDEYQRTAHEVAPHQVAPSRAQYHRWLAGQLKGGIPYPDACRVLESMFAPWRAEDLFGPPRQGGPDGGPTGSQEPSGSILESVPHSFPAGALTGSWVTCYQFSGDKCHADIACVTAISSSQIRAVNYPPEPRTEGRAYTFRNEIEATLANRHLIGHWKNVSDTRYFGSLHLAALPGEIVMEGYYTGFASDIEVSSSHWKWVRLAADSVPPEMILREPPIIYDLVMNHSQFDAPLALADVREDD